MTSPQLSPPRPDHSRLFGGAGMMVMPSPPPHNRSLSSHRRSSMTPTVDEQTRSVQMRASVQRRMSAAPGGSTYEVDKSPTRAGIPSTFRSAMANLRNESPAPRRRSNDEAERLSIENSRYVVLSPQQQRQQLRSQELKVEENEEEEEEEEENLKDEESKDDGDARMRIRSSDFSGDDIRRWLGGNNPASSMLPTRILNRQSITSHRQEWAKKREAANIRQPQHDAANDIVNSDEKFRFLRRLLAGGAASSSKSSPPNSGNGRATTNAAIRQQLLLSATMRNSSESRLKTGGSILEKATNPDSADMAPKSPRQARRASWLGNSFSATAAALEAESESVNSSSSDVFGTRSLRNMLLSLKTEELVTTSSRSLMSNQSASTQTPATSTTGGDTESPTFAASA